eukprot:m.128622 g.128622  ORF g.128622 m.128622 type:complete len:55 (-) comp15835_c0_seq1:2269-2433(-)
MGISATQFLRLGQRLPSKRQLYRVTVALAASVRELVPAVTVNVPLLITKFMFSS